MTAATDRERDDNPPLAAPMRRGLLCAARVLAAFTALSAIAGGLGIMVTDGLGMPRSLLEGSPFATFLGPGIILFLVVGGVNGAAFVLLCMRREASLFWTASSGIVMVIWIFVETGIISGWSWLQVIYFATGTAQIVAVLGLLGIVHWLPRASLRRPTEAADPL